MIDLLEEHIINQSIFVAMKILILFLLLLCCTSTCCISSPVSINSEPSIGRNLLQAKKACPVSFEFMNYTIITSRCKAPQYPPTPCCDAFKEFACPYADNLNDLSNDCSSKMFGYINSKGEYPDRLFANLCRDDKIGLNCPASPPTNVIGADYNNSPNIHGSSLLILTVGFLILFMWI